MHLRGLAQLHNCTFSKAAFNLLQRQFYSLFTFAVAGRYYGAASFCRRFFLFRRCHTSVSQGAGYRQGRCSPASPALHSSFFKMTMKIVTNLVPSLGIFSARVEKAETGTSPCTHFPSVEQAYHKHRRMSRSPLHVPPPLEGAAERTFIGIFQVTAGGQAARQSRDTYV